MLIKKVFFFYLFYYLNIYLFLRVNVKNAVRQASRVNTSEVENHNFFQTVNSNPNPE